jgi:hypothetical protein
MTVAGGFTRSGQAAVRAGERRSLEKKRFFTGMRLFPARCQENPVARPGSDWQKLFSGYGPCAAHDLPRQRGKKKNPRERSDLLVHDKRNFHD